MKRMHLVRINGWVLDKSLLIRSGFRVARRLIIFLGVRLLRWELCSCVFVFGSHSAVAIDAPSIPFFRSALPFSAQSRGYEPLDLPSGPMRYSEVLANEGYLPAAVVNVVGDSTLAAYDYPSGLTAYQIADQAELMLRRAGYRIEYRCDGLACGDIDGWRLYLGHTVAGEPASQIYLLASKEISPPSFAYTQIHVADLNGRARLVRNFHRGEPISTFKADEDGAGYAVFFQRGSAELSASARKSLRQWAPHLLAQAPEQIRVRGFTDEVGSAELNQQLGRRRAEAVVAWLQAEAGLSKVEIVAASNTGKESGGAYQSRRAEIQLIAATTDPNDAAKPLAGAP